ncbi:hypothetical protein HPT25_23325 [Bacillus sp. BRMEA1]|uniref:hypothetical protein n=1 Tax=Neobacillus endophyticus TaxID=2738405 RepID=UPI00156648BA|nr:hypothetical protein [Neobacillus endophyticus]NRD80257.1 hypothetical protein [Neobacillus endophyticus]
MNVTIEMHFIASGNKSMSASSFPLRGRKPEQVAYEWWKHIKKEMSYHAQLEKVIADGDQNITELVLKEEEEEWTKRDFITEDYLPF